ncbi:ABC transporter permease [Candidatus Woesearchaeota archaeon]|nr:ABC transporter permease [Candidatus Woesearchaeota archaeon]
MIIEYLRLSLNNLGQRKVRSWLTMIGIFIGIAAVVSLIGLGEGLRTAITSQFGFLGTDVLSVQASGIGYAGPPGSGVVEPLEDTLAAKIKKIPGVKTAFNRYIVSGTMSFNGKQGIGFAVNLPGGEDRKILIRMMNIKTEAGRLLKDTDRGKVMLGNSFLEEGHFGKPILPGSTVLLNNKAFEVVGILEKKGNLMMDGAVLVNDEDLFDISEDDGTTDIIAVIVENENKIAEVKEDVEKFLRKERGVKEGEENFEVSSPQQILDSLNSSLFAVQLFVYIIAGISLAVGGVGIMNTMYTAVLERRKEIGIMKAIGARNSAIFYLFFIESGFLGMVGGIIGITLGMIFAYGLAAIGRLVLGGELIQATISPYLIFGALAFSFGLGTFFGVLPALQASKLHPVDALRSK